MELLSPGGSFNHALSALKGGADAIYIGGKAFSARMSADNFSNEEILNIITYAHQIEKKVYVTLNTLLYQDEFFEAVEFAKFLYEAKVDGIIIQDLGLANYLHKTMPNLPLHASTQINCHNANQLKALKKIGFSRVVLARESNISLIKEAKKIGLEVEVFIHGALCVSYSGNCLMSSFIGSRSGNRGRCAQPCRLEYTLLKDGEDVIKNYSLSTKDLMTIDYIKSLYDLDVDSLKIEGRLKQKEYVYAVTKAYRNALDGIKNNKINDKLNNDKLNIQKMFSRKFTKGYLFDESPFKLLNQSSSSHQGEMIGRVIKTSKKSVFIRLCKDVHRLDGIRLNDKRQFGLQIGKMFVNSNPKEIAYKNEIIEIKNIEKSDSYLNVDVIRTSDYRLLKDIENSLKNEVKIPLKGTLYCYKNKPLNLEIKHNGIAFHIKGDIVEESLNVSTSFGRIKEQLSKSKDYPCYIDELIIKGDEDVFIPISALNDLRNRALEQYLTLIKDPYECVYNDYESNYILDSIDKRIVCVNESKGIIDDENVIVFDNDSSTNQRLNRIFINDDFKGDVVFTHQFNSSDKKLIASSYANITNSYALDAFYENGYIECELSLELDYHSIKSLINDFISRHGFKPNLGIYIYGKIDMMLIKSCLIGTINNNRNIHCNACHNHKYELKDRMGVKFELTSDDNCITRLLNPYPIYLIDKIQDLYDIGINSFYLHFNNNDDRGYILKNALENLEKEQSIMCNKFTRGHFIKRAE